MAEQIVTYVVSEIQESEKVCPLCLGQHGNNLECEINYEMTFTDGGL